LLVALFLALWKAGKEMREREGSKNARFTLYYLDV
jgi:hypothetical protein